MTPDTSRPADGLGHIGSDADVLAGLWEEAPFARLPNDAPNELKDYIEDIHNPKRVHAIHRASRRHNFQLLVQKYIVQLREGCNSEHCQTPTCFTCRKRIVGRAPIRRYNTTSARTLAVYLASQDNPESGLCPSLKPPKGPPAAMSSLIFTTTHKQPPRDDRTLHNHANLGQNGASPDNSYEFSSTRPPKHVKQATGQAAGPKVPSVASTETASGGYPNQSFTVTEEAVSKDYRSFAANVFGTVALKMLEWLTPSGIEDMSRKSQSFRSEASTNGHVVAPKRLRPSSSIRSTSVKSKTADDPVSESADGQGLGNGPTAPDDQGDQSNKVVPEEKREKDDDRQRVSNGARPANPRRNSNAKVRTSTTPKPKRPLSIEPFPSESLVDDNYTTLLKSPRLNGSHGEKTTRAIKTSSSALSRPISQLSSAGIFDDVTLERMPPLKHVTVRVDTGKAVSKQTDGLGRSCSSSPKEQVAKVGSGVTLGKFGSDQLGPGYDQESESEDDAVLPQALSRLNADLVVFLCDVLQEDRTGETHMLEPSIVSRSSPRFNSQGKALQRKRSQTGSYPPNMKLEWKLFVEQTFFYILSDPRLAVRSFTKKGQLYDSQTLWYCMLRLTRVAPTLVFHSLWVAAASLFAPPKSLLSLRSPTARLFPKHEKSLSNVEAGCLMSICLHALVAAAPLVTDTRQLYDMSRIRSHGLSLSGSGAVAVQPATLCLQYDDAFTNDLALRLARRLFAAITTRRYFDEMNEANLDTAGDEEPDVLAPLFSQLDFLNIDSVYIMDFSVPDRALHETRVPTLLLDWARAVMLNEWNGDPEVAGDGSFGGALALIDAMYKKRQALLLGDIQFRCEYFADRLDTVEMPIVWLSHQSTRQKRHLLDFPYIFNPATLVSYFRAINFSRMSHAFEESNSLQERMSFIVDRTSLVVSPHHKNVLQDLLQTASSKYLILDISRENVVRDAFDQLWRRETRELLRPLKVHLGEGYGEEGFDSGGVQQEFFRMAIAEALNADYGAFTVDERTRMTWFQPCSIEDEWKFELIGLLVSLAVFNGLTLPITFPKALYRKLLGEPVTELHHIADGWPDLANGLTSLLEWDEKDGLVEDVFARTYEFSVSVLGHPVTREMRQPGTASKASTIEDEEWPQFPKTSTLPSPYAGNPGEDEAPLVTNANRNAYVTDYIRYLTDVSVQPQFEAFARGFRTCLHPKSLGLLNSNLLQSVVEGVQEIDVGDLRRYTRYVGWDATHRTIKDFWSIVKRYDDNMKRKLLEFVTASDRVPVGGMKNLQFVVQKNGSEDGPGGHLPTAYTCYGTLLLPEYKDKEVLKERLAMALENAQGFGFA